MDKVDVAVDERNGMERDNIFEAVFGHTSLGAYRDQVMCGQLYIDLSRVCNVFKKFDVQQTVSLPEFFTKKPKKQNENKLFYNFSKKIVCKKNQ